MSCYIVTGGCGFIGSRLVQILHDLGHEVVVIDNLSSGNRNAIPKEINLIASDICDLASWTDSVPDKIDGCFHLAANPSVTDSMNNYFETHRINLGGIVAVFDWASKYMKITRRSVKVVYASSCAVYGSNQNIPVSEEMEVFPLNSYAADKRCGEIHARMVASAYGIPSIGLRFFNVFGPGQRFSSQYSGVLSIFCKLLANGKQVTIYGDGTQCRDFIFVDDVIQAMLKSMLNATLHSPAVLNVCTGEGTSLLEVGSIVANLCGADFVPKFAKEREGDIKFSVGDPSLSARLIDWKSSTNLTDGLVQTLSNVKK